MPAASASAARRASAPAATHIREKMALWGRAVLAADPGGGAAVRWLTDGRALEPLSAATTTHAMTTSHRQRQGPGPLRTAEGNAPPWWGPASAGRNITQPPTTSVIPIGGWASLTSGQGLRLLLEDGSRWCFRLSGTGTQGAHPALYLERYGAPAATSIRIPSSTRDLIQRRDQLAEIRSRTGMDSPQ